MSSSSMLIASSWPLHSGYGIDSSFTAVLRPASENELWLCVHQPVRGPFQAGLWPHRYVIVVMAAWAAGMAANVR